MNFYMDMDYQHQRPINNGNYYFPRHANQKRKYFREGDWICLNCNNLNFSFRTTFHKGNRCQTQTKKNNHFQFLMAMSGHKMCSPEFMPTPPPNQRKYSQNIDINTEEFNPETPNKVEDSNRQPKPFADITNLQHLASIEKLSEKVFSPFSPIQSNLITSGQNTEQISFDDDPQSPIFPLSHQTSHESSQQEIHQSSLEITQACQREAQPQVYDEVSETFDLDLLTPKKSEVFPSVSPILRNFKEISTNSQDFFKEEEDLIVENADFSQIQDIFLKTSQKNLFKNEFQNVDMEIENFEELKKSIDQVWE